MSAAADIPGTPPSATQPPTSEFGIKISNCGLVRRLNDLVNGREHPGHFSGRHCCGVVYCATASPTRPDGSGWLPNLAAGFATIDDPVVRKSHTRLPMLACLVSLCDVYSLRNQTFSKHSDVFISAWRDIRSDGYAGRIARGASATPMPFFSRAPAPSKDEVLRLRNPHLRR